MARVTEKATALDFHIGAKIRRQRENLGMTQGELAKAAGISYQQVHKYERGANRISAGRLGHFAAILTIPVQHFYDGFGASLDQSASLSGDSRLCLELARSFRQIGSARQQEALYLLVRALAN